jgi:uncharacterized protein YaiI (UPF0178 family)
LTIFVDADSCPVRVRQIIEKAAHRRQVALRFVAAIDIPVSRSPWVSMVLVESGPDAADDEIVSQAKAGDLVVTRDIPLAARLVEGGIDVINDRGTHYTEENIRPRLSERDFMAELRAMGLESAKDRSFSAREIQAFSATFDRELTRLPRSAEG